MCSAGILDDALLKLFRVSESVKCISKAYTWILDEHFASSLDDLASAPPALANFDAQ